MKVAVVLGQHVDTGWKEDAGDVLRTPDLLGHHIDGAHHRIHRDDAGDGQQPCRQAPAHATTVAASMIGPSASRGPETVRSDVRRESTGAATCSAPT